MFSSPNMASHYEVEAILTELRQSSATENNIPMASARVRGEGVEFERIRRITGYLVGDKKRFNDAKDQEELDRVKHMSVEGPNAQSVLSMAALNKVAVVKEAVAV